VLRFDWDYQVPLQGGHRVRTGQVVDFVTHNPFDQPVQVYGKHWHSGYLGMEDRLKLNVLLRHFGREAIIYWDYELPDQDTAIRAVRNKQG
jgi:hypothetical protein